jgi:hypothetical protein
MRNSCRGLPTSLAAITTLVCTQYDSVDWARQAPEPMRVSQPSEIHRAPATPAVLLPRSFAVVELFAATSASTAGITHTGYVLVRAIAGDCTGQRRVNFSFGQIAGGGIGLSGDPAVATTRAQLCIPVLVQDSLRALIGHRISIAHATVGELACGEQYTSADPEDLQAAGVSIYLPDMQGGYLAGVFATAGFLEQPDGSDRQPSAAVAVAVERVSAPLCSNPDKLLRDRAGGSSRDGRKRPSVRPSRGGRR